MHWNHISLATFLSLIVKAQVHTVTHGQLRKPQQTYVKRAIHKAHFKLNRAFKVTQGHPYWCQQKSRTACRRSVQLYRRYLWNLRENCRYTDFNDPCTVWRCSCKKRLWISTNNLYWEKLESLAYICASDSMGLCLLLFTQLFLKVKGSESRSAGQKRILTWNSHSRSF